MDGLGFTARSPYVYSRTWPGMVLRKIVFDFKPRCLGAYKKMTFHFVARRLIQTAKRQAHSFGIVVIGADEI